MSNSAISNKANHSRMQLIKSVRFALESFVCSCWKLMTQEVPVSVCFEPWCQESGTRNALRADGRDSMEVAGKGEANLRASSDSLPYLSLNTVTTSVTRVSEWDSELQNSSRLSALLSIESKCFPAAAKKVAFSCLFGNQCWSRDQNKTHDPVRTRTRLIMSFNLMQHSFSFLSATEFLFCNIKTKMFHYIIADFFYLEPDGFCWDPSLEGSVGFHLACPESDDNFRNRNEMFNLNHKLMFFSCSILYWKHFCLLVHSFCAAVYLHSFILVSLFYFFPFIFFIINFKFSQPLIFITTIQKLLFFYSTRMY